MYSPLCFSCARYDDNTCAAYPDGIPDEVFTNKLGHFWPMKNDRGIQFLPKDPNDEFIAEWRKYKQHIPEPGVWREDAVTQADFDCLTEEGRKLYNAETVEWSDEEDSDED